MKAMDLPLGTNWTAWLHLYVWSASLAAMIQCQAPQPTSYGARTKGAAGTRPLPPKLRAAAQKNDLRSRRVQVRVKEQRRLEIEAAKPGRKRAKARALEAAQRGQGSRAERAALFREVYGHIDPGWPEEASCAATVVLVGLAVVALAGTADAFVSTALLDVGTTLSSLAADIYAKVNAWIMGRAAPWALALWALVCAVRAVYLWQSRLSKRLSFIGAPGICAICTDSVEEDAETDQKQTTALVCGHRFHRGCIQPWLLEKRCCPLCYAPCSFAGME